MKYIFEHLGFVTGVIVTLLLTSLVTKPFDDWLTTQGYYGAAPSVISQAISRVGDFSSTKSFQIVAALVFGIIIGAWGRYLISKIKIKEEPSKEVAQDHTVDFMSLHKPVVRMLTEYWNGLNKYGQYDLNSVNEQTRISLNALYARLRRIGILVPETDGYAQPWQYNLMQIGYLERVIPYAQSGLIPEVNVEIKNFFDIQNKAFEEVMLEKRVPQKMAIPPPR